MVHYAVGEPFAEVGFRVVGQASANSLLYNK